MTELACNKNLRQYLFFWIGQQFSLLGSNVAQFVLIIWITLETESELYISLAFFLGFGPRIFIAPFAGVFADRWNRKLIIGTADTLQALATFGFILTIWLNPSNRLVFIFTIITLRGIFQAFHSPAVIATRPAMVPKEHLSRMNSVHYLTNAAILITGPALAGFLLLFFEVHSIMWIDIITWGLAILPLFFISIPSAIRNNNSSEQSKTSYKEDLVNGMKFLKDTKGLLAFLTLANIYNFFMIPLTILLAPYILLDNIGNLSDERIKQVFAVISAVLQVGIFVGALVMTIHKGFKKRVMYIMLSLFYTGLIGYICVAIAPFFLKTVFVLIGIGLFIKGFVEPLVNVTMVTVFQKIIPLDMQGRVMTTIVTIATAMVPISMVLSGIIAEALSIQKLFFICIGILTIGIGLMWRFTNLRSVENLIEEQETSS
ncbi:MAG: MFS transporter [Candidatus Heimdallarchaeota archaeon]|nr:MFS transporter [Candidatus Heimdallarchaeota archaeon]MCK4877894.1 MFS transporter [Candidatus Heimdallarchaeota archaeon]